MSSNFRKSNRSGVSFFAFQDIITSVTGILILVTLVLTLYVNNPSALSDQNLGAPEELTEDINEAEAELNALMAENMLRQRLISDASTTPDAGRLEAEIKSFEEQAKEVEEQLEQAKTESLKREQEVKELAKKFGLPELEEQMANVTNILAQLQQTNAVLEAELEDSRKQLEEIIKQRNKLWLVPDANPEAKENLLVVVSGTSIVAERFGQPSSKKTFSGSTAGRDFLAALSQWDTARTHLVFYVKPSGIKAFHQCQELAKLAGFTTGHDAIEEQTELLFAPPGQE